MTEMTRHRHKTAYFGGLRHRAPFGSNEVIRPKYRLILYFTASCLPFVPDRSTRLHISYPFTGHGFTMYMCANTPAFSPLSFYSERIHDLKFLLPVNVHSPQPLRRHSAL